MSVVIHLIKKDLRRFGLMFTAGFVACSFSVFGKQIAGGTLVALAAGLSAMLVGVGLVCGVVWEDSPDDPGAFWRTRPISGSQLLAAKVGLLWVLLAVVPLVIVVCSVPTDLSWSWLANHGCWASAGVGFLIALAASGQNPTRFAINGIAIVIGLTITSVLVLEIFGPVGPKAHPAGTMSATPAFPSGPIFTVCVSAAAVANHYLGHRRILTLALTAIASLGFVSFDGRSLFELILWG